MLDLPDLVVPASRRSVAGGIAGCVVCERSAYLLTTGGGGSLLSGAFLLGGGASLAAGGSGRGVSRGFGITGTGGVAALSCVDLKTGRSGGRASSRSGLGSAC